MSRDLRLEVLGLPLYVIVQGAERRPIFCDDFVDAATGRVTHVEAEFRFGKMTLSFATDYFAFETIDEVLVPLAEETRASGRHTASTKIESVGFGVPGLGPFTGSQ